MTQPPGLSDTLNTQPLPGVRGAALSLLCSALAAAVLIPGGALAADSGAAILATHNQTYAIPAGPLGAALNRYSLTSGVLVSADARLTDGKHSSGLQGLHSAQEALQLLLAGTGLRPVEQGGAIVLQPALADQAETLDAIRVDGLSDISADLPRPFAGGQVATGGRLGLMGDVNVFRAPFSTQSYTETFVEDQQARRLSDVIDVDPSVRSAMAEYGDTETYIVRGFPLFTTQIGVNGLYGMTEGRRITPEFYERIDVLKGPASMLYGMTPFGAIGGNVNLVSKRATDTPITRLTASYLTKGQAGGHLDLGRRFGPDNAWGIRVNALVREGDTPIDRQSDRMRNAAVALDYRGSKLKVSLDATNQDRLTRAHTANMTYNPGFDLPEPPKNSHNFADDWEYIRTDANYWMARAEYEFTPAATVFAGYGESKGHEEYYYAASQMRRLINSQGDYTARAGGYRGRYNAQALEAGLRGNLRFGGVTNRYALAFSELNRKGYGLTVSAPEGYTGNIYETPNLPAPEVNYGPLLQNGDLRLSSVGFVNTFGILDEQLMLTLGLREQRIRSGVFSSGVRTGSYEDRKRTPTVALLVRQGKYSFYANYSEGLAQGSTAPSGTVNRGEQLPPFVTRQYEAGIKYDGGDFGLTAAVFQITQPSAYTNSANVFAADGEQRNRGVELAVFGEPARGLRLLGGVTLIDAKQTRTANGQFDGNKAIGVPMANIVFNAEYDLPAMPELTLTGRVSAFSRAEADAGNTQHIPGWARLDLGARYVTELDGHLITLRANVLNVTNRSYWNSVSRGFITAGAPRTFMLSATIDF